jgi:O-acetylserine/cysteine efflux transporter
VVPFVCLSLLFDAPVNRWQWTAAPWQSWVAVAYLGWASTIFAYSMWTTLIKRHGANRISPFSLAIPVVGLSSGTLFLDETITGWQWAGIAMIVAALGCVLFGGRLAWLRPESKVC